MKKRIIIAICAAVTCLTMAFALTGCGSAKKVELQIFAANSLEKALPEVQALYTKAHSNVTFADTQFKGSGDLVAQLEGGASSDILITASKSTMTKAQDKNLVDADTVKTMFNNDLVIVTAEGSSLEISDVKDLATNDAITSIAIGDPNAVPAGNYALQTLKAAGLATYNTDDAGKIVNVKYDASIANKMNAGADKVGTVASYVKNGQCEVGFVYSSDQYRYDGLKIAYTTPSDMHKDIVYPGAICAGTENAETAKDFLEFCMTNQDALKIWQKYGFEVASK